MRAPRTFDDLKQQISRRFGELSGRLQQIAEFALRHPNELALGTVATVATNAGVQPSSIIRFANFFGYEGFSDMQLVFRARLVAHSPSYRERIAVLRNARAGTNGATPAAMLAQFAGDGIAALEQLHETVSGTDLERAIALMAKAGDIYVLAQGRSFPVAFYINYVLSRLDQRSRLMDGVGGMVEDQARLIARDDVLIAISFKDYSPEVVAVVESCQERGVKTIALTDSPLSPIAKRAAVSFEIPDDHTQPFRSLVAPMCLAQSLVVAFGDHLANRPN
jgi:DNA-binding MurR/RpiR family transcriptional regulator